MALDRPADARRGGAGHESDGKAEADHGEPDDLAEDKNTLHAMIAADPLLQVAVRSSGAAVLVWAYSRLWRRRCRGSQNTDAGQHCASHAIVG